MNKHTITDLYQMQSLPLKHKITMTKQRIRGWYEHWDGNVYVSFSGGKDSTVLLDIVRQMYPDVPAVFVDTGLEYPEIREFVKTFDNVTWLKPKMNFRQVIEKYGYPMFSKEVSETVYYAKKYLQGVQEQMTIADRQTDRQTPYSYSYDRLCGQGKYAKTQSGGADSKYRKLRGLAEFSKKQGQMGDAVQGINSPRSIRDSLGEKEKGDYP